MTAAVWIRGILAEHYGVAVDSVRYRTGGLHRPGRTDKIKHAPRAGVEIQPIPPGATLDGMLAEGTIDALYSPHAPVPSRREIRGSAGCSPIRAHEERYYTATGIFPIMHVIALPRDVYEQRPWLARSLFEAFEEARRLTAARMEETAATRYMVPWLYADLERTHHLMGDNLWTYGLGPNAVTPPDISRLLPRPGPGPGQPTSRSR